MAKVKVFIEETLCREIEFDLPEDMNVNERMEAADELARRAYKNNEIVLTADDFNGQAQIMVKDVESETETNWIDL